MRNKIIVVSVLSAVIVVVLTLLNRGSNILSENIKTTAVFVGDFQQQYKSTAVVSSYQHSYFFNGYITSLKVAVGDYVVNDSVLLSYKDFENKSYSLKTGVDGYVSEISSDRVIINDLNFFIVCKLNLEHFELISEDCEAIFSSNKRDYLATFLKKSAYGYQIDDLVYYDAFFNLDDNNSLKLNQQGNLVFLLNRKEALIVDKSALLSDEQGDFLIDSRWLKDLSNFEKYRIEIKILEVNDRYAIISGIELEDREVCIVDGDLRAFLSD